MSDDLRLILEISGRDDASASLRSVTTTLQQLEKQASRTGQALKTALGADFLKPIATARTEAKGLGTDLAEAADRAGKAIRGDIAAVAELRTAMRELAAEQKAMGRPQVASPSAATIAAMVPTTGRAGAPGTPTAPEANNPTSPAEKPATARRNAVADDFAPWRAKARLQQASERADAADMRRKLAAGRYGMAIRQRSERLAQQAEAATTTRTLSEVGRRWRLRQASEAAERREVERTGESWNRAQRRRMAVMDRSAAVEARRQREESSRAAAQSRTESAATDRRMRDVGRIWRMRQASEAAEARHVATMRREREAARNRAMGAGRHAYGHARHAVRSINHPVHESLGFALTAGAAFGGAAAEQIVRASEAFDTSMSRLRMFAPQLDAGAIRKQALSDSVALGVDASVIVDSIAKSVRDGVPPAIAESLPKSIVQTAQVMGGNIERLTDSLAEGIQESTAMGWIKDKTDARKFLNLEAGLSTTAGNTSEKTEQFIAAGGLGHGKEMGLDLTNTMAYGAMLNASGARTGQASAKFMGQLSQNTPKMVDKFRQATESHKNTEEDRAVRSAPRALGYGGIREMQAKIMAGPEGLIDFAVKLEKLDDKARKLTLEGYGFSEQGGAMLAELGSNGGAKGKAVLARAKELADQKESDDYLSEKFGEWSKSLAFMLQQIEKGWRAIENEIGDVFKADIVTPFRDWWVELSSAIVGGDLRERVHGALMGFVHGLGFDDFRHLLDAMTTNVHGFDFAGFARGVGEGIRAVVDNVRSVAGMFGGAGGISAETVGRLATEFLGLSLALRFIAPVVSTVGGIASAFLAVKAAVQGAAWLSELTGLSGALKAIVGTEIASSAAGLLSFAGALGIIGAAVQGLLSLGILNKVTLIPKSTSKDDMDDWLWGKKADGTSARPAWVDKLTGHAAPGEDHPRFADGGLIGGPGSGRSDSIIAKVSNGEFVVNAAATARNLPILEALNSGRSIPAYAMGGMMGGGRFDRSTGGSSSAAAGGIIVSAMLGTGRGFDGLRDRLDVIADLLRQEHRSDALRHGEVLPVDTSADAVRTLLAEMRAASLGLRSTSTTSDGATASGFGPGSGRPNLRYGRDGGAARGDTPNMRYGRDGSGRRRGTPGTGEAREIGPRVGLGKMGAKFGAKAPVIMDGLMKKYGLTREQAAGVVGNLGHESAGFTAYHEGGQASGRGGVGWAQWTGPRRRAFEDWTKAHNLNPTSDEASWRYLTEGDPETAGAITAVKGTNNRRDATRAWHDKFERSADILHGVIVKPKSWNSRLRYADQAFAGVPGGATVEAPATGDTPNPGGSGRQGDAVDSAMGMMGFGERQAAASLKHIMHAGEWCADFVNGTLEKSGIKGSSSAMARSFSGWGHHVDTKDVAKGDVIEERHGDHVGHVGFATGKVQRDRSGTITAVQMISGNFGNKVQKNWEQVGAIADLRRSNEAVAAAAAKVTRQSDAVAKQVPTRERPRPDADSSPRADASAAPQRQADSSTTIHAPIHIHGVSDPHHAARLAFGHVDRMNSRYTDREAIT